MNAELNQYDIDNLKLSIDKMKSVDFDAARKMELLLEAYERQDEDDRELNVIRDRIDDLPGWRRGTNHLEMLESVSDTLERALDNAQEWRDSKDDEPLDEVVKRLVEKVDTHAAEVSALKDKLADVFNDMLAIVDREPKDLITLRNLVVKSLEFIGD